MPVTRFAGIDIASQTHVVAIVGEAGNLLVKPTVFSEDAAGYRRLFALLGTPDDILVAFEATGHTAATSSWPCTNSASWPA